MNTNIIFKSNVYPIDGSLKSDKKYLIQIKDFTKLNILNEKYFKIKSFETWSKLQYDIIKQPPSCSKVVDKYEDPCWGIIKKNNENIWISKCVNIDCIHIKNCRSEVKDEEISIFSPVLNSFDEDLYRYKSDEYYKFPILSMDVNQYNIESFENLGEREKNSNTIDIIEVLKNEENELYPTENVTNSHEIPDEIELEETEDEADRNQDKLEITYTSNDSIFDKFLLCEQSVIIEADYNNIQIVNAGPGTGKTYTLINKIINMVTLQHVNPEGIVVLCYTNAAVNEIRNRLKDHINKGGDRGLANVDVRTFHSFAWWYLNQINETMISDKSAKIDLTNINYDQTIVKAHIYMEKYAENIFGNWEHLIVDEIQDLTNDLARFTIFIVENCMINNCGITVLGDYCQSIYDYTRISAKEPLLSFDFYSILINKLKSRAEFITLNENHRQFDDLQKITSPLRSAILSQNKDMMNKAVSHIYNNITAINNKYDNLLNTEIFSNHKNEKMCLLLRNNGNTLKLSSDLRKIGVEHVLNVKETSFNYSTWISDIFNDYLSEMISYDIFKLRYDSIFFEKPLFKAEDVWKRLKFIIGSNSDNLKVRDILDAISTSKKDDPILRIQDDSNIIVSTIHKSKGREFDNVVIDKSFIEGFNSENKDIDEYKMIYVAATRAKKNIYKEEFVKSRELYQVRIKRNHRRRWGKFKSKKIIYFEFNSDIDLKPDIFLNIDQNYFSKIKIGDPLKLRRVLNKDQIYYEIVHEIDKEIAIGKLGVSYIDDLRSCMSNHIKRNIEMPNEIGNLYVSGLFTYIASVEEIEKNPGYTEYAPNGVWKWVDIVGLGHVKYDTY